MAPKEQRTLIAIWMTPICEAWLWGCWLDANGSLPENRLFDRFSAVQMDSVSTSRLAKSDAIRLYRAMALARKIDERLIRLYHHAKIYGGVYTGIGHEAIGAAAAVAGGPDDLYAPLIRDLAVHTGRGETPRNIFRQWLARADGPTRGRDGNVHFGNMSNGVYAMISHLGAMLSVVVGGVMARRRRGIRSIGFAFIGDGGTSTGDFHEAVNFAAVFDAPVVFLIENNHYAYSTPSEFQYRCANLADKAVGYGIEGIRADGNDAFSLYAALCRIAKDIREKPRPVLIECDTMRMRGHGEHDDFSYVPRELLARYAARDPIRLAREQMLAAGLASPQELEALEAELSSMVEAAYLEALRDPPPSPATLLNGVYAGD